MKNAGADCIKILLYYAPADAQSINDHKHAWVERIGDECLANDIPFFLEVIAYEEGLDEKGLEFEKKKPDLVAAYMREISRDQYGVDDLKVEVPINMKFVEGMKSFAGTGAYIESAGNGLVQENGRRWRSGHGLSVVRRRQQRRIHRNAR